MTQQTSKQQRNKSRSDRFAYIHVKHQPVMYPKQSSMNTTMIMKLGFISSGSMKKLRRLVRNSSDAVVMRPDCIKAMDPLEGYDLPRRTAEKQVEESWNWPFNKILAQLSKDLPRFANKLILSSNDELSHIKTSFGEMCKRQSIIFRDSLSTDEIADVFLSPEAILSMNNQERQLYELKLALLTITFFLEDKSFDSAPFRHVMDNFDGCTGSMNDLSSQFGSFLSEAFLSVAESANQHSFPVTSQSLNIMRAITQGHYASIASAFQECLGLENMTRNQHHQIFLVLPHEGDADYIVQVIHLKAETATWGQLKWELCCVVSPTGELQSIKFSVYELEFTVGSVISPLS